jgi:hypothetical protein
MPEKKPYCCHVGCEDPAVYTVQTGPGFEDFTEACERHLGELVNGDGLSVVYPVEWRDDPPRGVFPASDWAWRLNK